ncbi:PP2C family protein-serine/threonine phosphatase [Nonomuraea sp. NEAU-A123]|uniref:PP2C family protein-serine/threonine phosphatase n=1 Tax=Nonomuraea sp. NEAU-A123 TaxID=2839649 RepID=UPI001BE3DD32|nr:GAF domain-containing SpoIIE family protein phosphatase [Nonomuraea sp. NEAU-A123]MBT2230092.1 SpoIIE family protein phosphatase [Nonomuraea sp. NEAU-A123]MBT2230638.1 SpoIIE family protein phosphatase [Nonomuraea sp. NEAU-A123]
MKALDALERLGLLSEVSKAMNSSLDADTALHRLARLLVPRLADWCAVDLVENDTVRRVSVAHRGSHAQAAGLPDVLGPLPLDVETPLLRALRSSGPLLINSASADSPDDGTLREARVLLHRLLGADSAFVAPIRVRGNVLGALTLVRVQPGAAFTLDDLPVVEDLAHRAGLALDNARLYGLQHEMAYRLQHSLLPQLPDVHPLRLAARYLPARQSSRVGGDWYDAFVLSGGAVTLVIGDVAGHDIAAAAQMSEVRNMLRALAFDRREPPSGIVTRLDRALTGLGGGFIATMVLARVEGPPGGPWRMRWTNAGHPAPLLITREGGTRFLEDGRATLLGVDAALPRQNAVEALPPHSTVVLYTDGLIERRTEPLERGMTRLRRRAAALAGAEVETFCDELLAANGTANEDDIALLAVRLPGRS